MDCELIQVELVPYHFGVIDAAPRARVEEHLLGCPTCLRDFVALKRDIETAGEAPSAGARTRLRQAVAVELGVAPRAGWQRPVAFILAAATLMGAFLGVRVLAEAPGSPPRTLLEQPT